MKFHAIFVLLGVCLGTAGCAAKAARTPPLSAAPAPQPREAPSTAASDEPISVAQTNVILPKPQPIQAGALSAPPPEITHPPEPSSPAARPRIPVPKPEPRQQATAPPAQVPTPPPASPAVSRRRIRPVESPAERNRLLTEVASRQRQAQDLLGKARTRPLSDAEKGATERIQAFLDQTEAALKDQDLQQADALSSRALLLCQELNSGK